MNEGSVGKGIGMGIVFTVCAAMAAGVLTVAQSAIGLVFLLGIGVVQLLWIVPAVSYYRNRGERETAKGVTILAGLIFLVNAGCWGLVAGLK